MATKSNVNHVLKIIKSNKHHKLIDVFFVLSKISIQFREEQTGRDFFIVYTDTDSEYNLCKIIKQEAPYFKSRTTVASCLNTLKDMNILYYSKGERGWIIREMDEMLDHGFIKLRKIFFTKLFYDLNITEKKALVYTVFIMSTKGYKSVRKIVINLKDDESKWRGIFKSDNIYYLRKRIVSILKKYFRDISEPFRKKELNNYNYDKNMVRNKKKQLGFKFLFEPYRLITETIDKYNKREILEELKDLDQGFYGYIHKTKMRLEEKISNKFTDDIIISLMRCCKGLSYNNKQYIADRVVKKLFDKNEIASPDKYIGKIVLAYMQEF